MSASDARTTIPAWVVVVALALLTGLQPLTTDMYLPALPQMQQGLGMTGAAAQSTLSALILSFGIGQLVWEAPGDIDRDGAVVAQPPALRDRAFDE